MPDEDIKTFDAMVAEAIPSITEQTGIFYPARIRTDEAWHGHFNSVGEKAYAVLEGITFDLYRLVFDELASPEGTSLTVIGGGSHSAVWLQLIADILNCPVSAGSGDGLLGAAAMAAGRDVVPVDSEIFYPDVSRRLLLEKRRLEYIEHIACV